MNFNLKRLLEISTLKRIILFSFSIILGDFVGKLLIGKTFEIVLLYSNEITLFSQILIFVCLVSFTIICFFLLFKYKYRVNYIEYLLLAFISSIYIQIKLEFNLEHVILWPVWENIGIIDCFFIVFFTTIVASNFWKNNRERLRTEDNYYLEDNHEGTEENEDSYQHLINRVSPILFNDQFNTSFSVGIVGPWGIGKSSLIKSIERKIEKSKDTNLIYFKFSPTLNHNEDQLINEFFLNLSNNLKYRNSFLSKDLKTYSRKLVELIDKKGINFLLDSILPNDQSLSDYFKKISTQIKEQELRIIISIDDLDRLTPDEIYEVLKLIRNTSNFPNSIFLVALDKEYIINALKEKQNSIEDRFLDKYFQLELHVSKIPEPNLLNYIEGRIDELFNKRGVNAFNIASVNSAITSCNITNYILNFRDAKRFLNQFILDYSLVNQDLNIQEIDSLDLVRMTLIKIQYPRIFNTLIFNKDLFTNEINDFRHIKGLLIMGRNTPELKNSTTVTHFEGYQNFSLPENPNEFKKVSDLLIGTFALFFSESDTSFMSEIPNTCIKNESVYRLYFERTFSSNEISITEFNKIINYELVEIEHEIYQFNERKVKNLIGRLFEYIPQDANNLEKKLFAFKYCMIALGRVDQNIINHMMTTYRMFFIQNGNNNDFILDFLWDQRIDKINRSQVLQQCFGENGLFNLPQDSLDELGNNLVEI